MNVQSPPLLRRRLAPFALLLLIAAGLFVLAYQVPLRQTIAVGGDLAERRRFDDAPFLWDVNGSEPADILPDPANPAGSLLWYEFLERNGGEPYRWTESLSTFVVPGAGGGRYVVSLRAAGGRPDGSATPIEWQFNSGPLLSFDLPAGPRRYHMLIPADNSGDIRLTMRSTPLDAPGDPRELGFVLYQAQVAPLAAGWRAPAWPQIAGLTLVLASLAGSMHLLAIPPRLNLLLSAGTAIGAALSLALARSALTLFTPVLLGLSLFALAAAASVYLLTRVFGRADPNTRIFSRHIGALILLAFVLRMGGMLHPHAIYSDSGFHANKLFTLELGQVFQSATLPDEAGGGETPYPTGAYLLLAPGALLIPDGHRARVLLVQSGTALLDSLTVGMIALVVLRAGIGRAAALFAALCYLLPITALESFAVGELANLGGQALAMPWIMLLALGYAGSAYRGRLLITVGLIGALCAGLLGHSGVTLSVGAFTAAAWGIAWFSPWRRNQAAIDPRRLTFVAALALVLVILGYYSAPRYLAGFLSGGAVSAAETTGTAPIALFSETIRGVLGLAPPRARFWPLPIFLGLAAIGGSLLLWRERRSEAAGLRIVLAAGWIGMFLTQGLLLVADQGVRWSIFLYPLLCLSAGVLLGVLWDRGRLERIGAVLITSGILGYGLLMWIIQIRDYFHS